MSYNDILERTFVSPKTEHIHKKKYPDHWERYEFALKYCEGKKVVDVACGPGYGTAYLSKVTRSLPIGLDIDSETIKVAKLNYGEYAEFIDIEGYSWPIPDSSIDTIVSMETFEHLDAPQSFLAECARILKSGGKLVMSTPLNETESRFKPENEFHIREYTWNELGDEISKTFKINARYSQVSKLSSISSSKSLFITLFKKIFPVKLRKVLVKSFLSSSKFTSGNILEGKHDMAGVQIVVAEKK